MSLSSMPAHSGVQQRTRRVPTTWLTVLSPSFAPQRQFSIGYVFSCTAATASSTFLMAAASVLAVPFVAQVRAGGPALELLAALVFVFPAATGQGARGGGGNRVLVTR